MQKPGRIRSSIDAVLTLILVVLLRPSAVAADGPSAGPPYDLSKVSGSEYFPQDPALRDLLARNGFVVVRNFHRQIFTPYVEGDFTSPYMHKFPALVTVESAVRTYTIILEQGLRCLEIAQAVRLQALSRHLLASLSGFEPGPFPLARTKVLAWAGVGLALQEGEGAIEFLPPDAREFVRAELSLISREAIALSPIFPGRESFLYSALRPTGIYARDPALGRFYRAVKWFGLTSFWVETESEAQGALLIALAARQSPDLLRELASFERPYEDALGRAEDIGPAAVAAVLAKLLPDPKSPLAAQGAPVLLERFQAALRELPAPRSNDQILTQGQFQEFGTVTRGLRLLAPRPSWSGELFTTIARKMGRPPIQALQGLRALGDAHAETFRPALRS